MSRIHDFKNSLKHGGARPNHFWISLSAPAGVVQFVTSEMMLCKAASLPASTVIDIPVMYRGREVHFAGERTFAPWTVTIINELNFSLRRKFERWMHLIQHNGDTSGREKPLNYQQDLLVQQLSRNNESDGVADLSKRTYKFYEAYPIEVSEIALSYDIPNAVEEFTVTFVYDYFKVADNPASLSGTN